MHRQQMQRLIDSARVARLATVAADGRPHLVPVCFVVVGEIAYTAVDDKPKRGTTLRRVSNIEATGLGCLLVDHYSEDWSTLYWVRLDCRARVVADQDERAAALAALAAKYRQYTDRTPTGPVLALDIERWSGWSASGG